MCAMPLESNADATTATIPHRHIVQDGVASYVGDKLSNYI
jgi:hypothetical protein